MPLYEYACDACGHRFEAIQKFSDLPLDTCPKCSGAVRKLQSAPAFQFKGSGWYITDYARKDQGAKAEDGKKEQPSKSEGKEQAGKGDAKDTGAKGDSKESGSGGSGKSEGSETKPSKPAPAA